MFRFVLSNVLLLILFPGALMAIDRQVPLQFATINEAIAASSDGDRILVSAGTYPELVDFDGKAIEIIGLDGADQTILEGEGSFLTVVRIDAPSGLSRLEGFTVQNGFGVSCGDPLTLCGGGIVLLETNAEIKDCVLLGNSAANGGGLHAEYSTVSIEGCLVMNNFSNQGAGISIQGGSCQLFDTVIMDNVATGWGGGLYAGGEAIVVIDQCDFTANSSESGGGFLMSGVSGSMTNCLVDGNQAIDEGGGGLFEQFCNLSLSDMQIIQNSANDGGGLGVTHFCDIDLVDSVISGNSAVNAGGGIFNFETFSTYRRLRIVGNTAGFKGGGILARILGDPVIENCLIMQNHATEAGGGISCIEGVSPEILHCTIDRNSTHGFGGGIRADNLCYPNVVNSIIWRNQATQQTGISRGPQSDFQLIHVVMQGADPAEPLVFQLDADLDDFGYPGECSAAIDEGTDDYPGLPATDIDGVIRPQGLRRDLGAFETPGFGHCFIRGDCDGNTLVQISDALLLLAYLFGGQELTGCVNACDFEDDGFVTVSDAIQIISLIFQGGDSPAPPYPFPGPDVNLNNNQVQECWVLP
ncbi:MAG: hypothetical protein CBC13_06185 [Planctomycetia bacterium TMED53]|nr:MAG: hypothetical protein CBC13_06185 [Planctomycetia bacterium TMED53]